MKASQVRIIFFINKTKHFSLHIFSSWHCFNSRGYITISGKTRQTKWQWPIKYNISVLTYIDPNVCVLRIYNLDGRHGWVQVVLYIVNVGWRFCKIINRQKYQLQSLLSSVQKLHPNAVIKQSLILQKVVCIYKCLHVLNACNLQEKSHCLI